MTIRSGCDCLVGKFKLETESAEVAGCRMHMPG